MRKLTIDEFHAEIKAQGAGCNEDIAFRCPVCGTVQSARDLIAAGAGETFDDVEKFLAFSCFGRWTDAGPFKKDAPPGKGCDWTLGGLFGFHDLAIVTEDGEEHPRFELATKEEMERHKAKAATAAE